MGETFAFSVLRSAFRVPHLALSVQRFALSVLRPGILYLQKMDGAKNLWFTYEPIPHTDKGYIYCEGPIQLTARVTRFNNGSQFSIEYEGRKNDEIESVLKQMNEWFFYTHIKDAEDNEF